MAARTASTLRHYAASVWLQGGVNPRAVADYLGHTDPGFTLRVYGHLLPEANDQMRRAVDAALASSPVVAQAAP